MTYDVCAIGELLIDFAFMGADENGYPTLKANPGGAPCNLLAALSAYGCKCAFIGKVGADNFGELLIGTLKKAGIDTKGVVLDSNVFTTLAFVTFDETGNRSFSFARKPGADICLKESDIDFSLIDECKDFHFGTVNLTDEPAREANARALDYARKKQKLISFDPNLRKSLWNDLNEAKEEMLWGLSNADIVKISEDETDFLFARAPEEAAKIIHEEYGVKLVFITLGENGCYYSANNFTGTVPAPGSIKAVDTTGAGDIFGGSMLSRILQSGKELTDLTDDDLKNVTRFACCAASLSTMKQGGISSIAPLSEVENLLQRK